MKWSTMGRIAPILGIGSAEALCKRQLHQPAQVAVAMGKLALESLAGLDAALRLCRGTCTPNETIRHH